MSNLNNIKSKINIFKRNTCGPINAFQPTLDATCAIRENHIACISYFLTTVLINSPSNILLSELKGGDILNRGSFGYIFKPNNNKNIVIKIVVCIKENPNYKLYLDNEIDIHKKLSLYGYELSIDNTNPTNLFSTNSFGNTYFMQLYGYFIKNKDNIYEYKTIEDRYAENKIRLSSRDNSFLEDACEVYLLCEEASNDLKSLILTEKRLDRVFFNKFIKLLDFYKVSLKFMENENKIFIHSDIKLENIVESKTGELKFIDFGLSKLSNTFFLHNSDGTESIFKLLFIKNGNPQNLYDNNLCVVSPLFDIFSVLVCIFGLVLHREMIDITVTEINHNIKYQINYYKTRGDNFWIYLENLLLLFNSIYEFHQTRLKKYYEDKLAQEHSMFSRLLRLFINPLDTYISSFSMKDFKLLSNPEILYKNTGNENIDSLNYIKNILEHLFRDLTITNPLRELEEVVIDLPPQPPQRHPIEHYPITELEEVIVQNPQPSYYKFTNPVNFVKNEERNYALDDELV